MPPNLDALASTLGHMYATVNGTLAPGQEPAKYSSVYQHLPKHLRIEEGTVIPQIPLLTSWGGEVVNCCYSEELANELLKIEYGSVEKGKKAVKEFMEVAEYLGASNSTFAVSLATNLVVCRGNLIPRIRRLTESSFPVSPFISDCG